MRKVAATILAEFCDETRCHGIGWRQTRVGLCVSGIMLCTRAGYSSRPKASSSMHGLQLLFTMLITVQFVVIVLHDLRDIPGWTNGTNAREVVGRKKLWLAATINACFPDGGCVCNLRVERAATRICCELLCGNSSGPTTTSLSRARS